MISQAEFEILLPLACDWAEKQERNILHNGVALSALQMTDARNAGVAAPENVRHLRVTGIPSPEHPGLRAAAVATNLISPSTWGMTLRYGIFIRQDGWGDRRLLVHELVHVSQYERLGGFFQFFQKYLHECITIGYPAAPMEQEAINTAARLVP
jgi:hypothetical protein